MNRTDVPALSRSALSRLPGVSDRRLWALLVPVTVALLILLSVMGFGVRYHSSIYPGVSVLGMDLSGMSEEAAAAKIQERVSSHLARPVRFAYGAATLTVPAEEMGIDVDARATAANAFEVGRSGNPLSSWGARLDSLTHGRSVPLVVELNRQKATSVVRRMAARVDRPVRDASIALSANGPVLHNARTGLRVDVPAMVARMSSSVNVLYEDGRAITPVVAVTQPSVTSAELSGALQRLRAVWSSPLLLAFQGRQWTLGPEQAHGMMSLSGTGTSTAISLDRIKLSGWVRQVAAGVDREPTNARIVVEPGRVSVTGDQSGYELDVARTVQALEEAVGRGDNRAEAVVRVVPPSVTEADLEEAAGQANSLISHPLTLELGDRTWTLDTGQLTSMLAWRGEGASRTPYLDATKLRAWVVQVAREINTRPQDARIAIASSGARVVPERTGVEVRVQDTLNRLLNASRSPERVARASVRVTPPSVRATDLRAAADRTNALIGQPVTLSLEGRTWTVDTGTLRSWLRWRGSGADVEPYLDPDRMYAFVQSIASQEDRDVQNAYLSAWQGSVYEGRIFVVPDRTGVWVDVDGTTKLLRDLAASETHRSGEVVATITRPTITSDDLQGPLERATRLTGHRLYLKAGGHTWWLDPADIVKTSKWTDDTGADTKVWLDTSLMQAQIQAWVPQNVGNKAVDYVSTAQKAVSALERGDHSINIVLVDRRDLDTKPGKIRHVPDLAVWDGHPPKKWIDINLSSQSMAAYEGNKQVRVSLITSGNYPDPSRRTPTGVYYIMRKDSPHTFISPWPKDSPYYYPPSTAQWAMLFKSGGYYIHDAPWRPWFGPGSNIDSGTPGEERTGSHGCVNTPHDMMQWLWSWTPEGTPVVIHY